MIVFVMIILQGNDNFVKYQGSIEGFSLDTIDDPGLDEDNGLDTDQMMFRARPALI